MRIKNRTLDSTLPTPTNQFDRWWIYQQERFPIFKHGLLILIFATAALCFSAMVNGRPEWPDLVVLLAGFVSAFFFFLQLRIADEFKDFEEDNRYRPYRAVPRGVVSLKALAGLGIAGGLVQLGLALWLDRSLVVLLLGVWSYMVLMTREFFVRDWLKARPVIYLLSHMLITPLLSFYLMAFDWLVAGDGPAVGLVWLPVVSFFNGLVIELGRKIRAPQTEETGVETYSALWGIRRAVLVWLGALFLAASSAGLAAVQINFLVPVGWISVGVLVTAGGAAGQFLREPTVHTAGRFELIAGLWTLLIYLGLGPLPLLITGR
jgi:4-hydroxybenzoate polyprenyltransferase